jgi:hypothetical protein
MQDNKKERIIEEAVEKLEDSVKNGNGILSNAEINLIETVLKQYL